MKVRLPLMKNVINIIAKSVLIPLGLTDILICIIDIMQIWYCADIHKNISVWNVLWTFHRKSKH